MSAVYWSGPPSPGHLPVHRGISIEFLNLGGCLSYGHSALESHAHVLAIAEYTFGPCQSLEYHHSPSPKWYLLGLGPCLSRCYTWLPCSCGRSWFTWCATNTSDYHHCLFRGVLFSTRTGYEGGPPWGVEVSPIFVLFTGKGDPEKLALIDQLLTSVLCEARLCCSGQPVILVGGLGADPLTMASPFLAKGISGELEHVFVMGGSCSLSHVPVST